MKTAQSGCSFFTTMFHHRLLIVPSTAIEPPPRLMIVPASGGDREEWYENEGTKMKTSQSGCSFFTTIFHHRLLTDRSAAIEPPRD
jgi:hypothetical protein